MPKQDQELSDITQSQASYQYDATVLNSVWSLDADATEYISSARGQQKARHDRADPSVPDCNKNDADSARLVCVKRFLR